MCLELRPSASTTARAARAATKSCWPSWDSRNERRDRAGSGPACASSRSPSRRLQIGFYPEHGSEVFAKYTAVATLQWRPDAALYVSAVHSVSLQHLCSSSATTELATQPQEILLAGKLNSANMAPGYGHGAEERRRGQTRVSGGCIAHGDAPAPRDFATWRDDCGERRDEVSAAKSANGQKL